MRLLVWGLLAFLALLRISSFRHTSEFRLGLGDAEDITVKGLQIVKRVDKVYLEAYTSILTVGKDALEEFYGRTITIADREFVEQQVDGMLEDAKTTDIAFLVVGDPFGATTHSDLILRALQEGVSYKVIHNASILNAVGCCGLQLYNFGETVSIVFWTDTWKPDSYCDKISVNRNNGFHTLCLLDIKVKEQSLENLMKGKKIYEPPRYMNVKQAATQLLQVVEKKRDEGLSNLAFDENTICVGLARIGSDTEKLLAGTLHQMAQVDMGLPLHSLVVAGYLHPMELEMLRTFAIDVATFDQLLHERFQDRPWLQDAQ